MQQAEHIALRTGQLNLQPPPRKLTTRIPDALKQSRTWGARTENSSWNSPGRTGALRSKSFSDRTGTLALAAYFALH